MELTTELKAFRETLEALGRTAERIDGLADQDTIRRAMDGLKAEGFNKRTLKRILSHALKILEYKTTIDRRVQRPDNPREEARFQAYIDKGYSITMIQADTGLSRGTVQRKLDRYSSKKYAVRKKSQK